MFARRIARHRAGALSIAAAVALAASPAIASVFGDFQKVWAERNAQYHSQEPALDTAVTETQAKLFEAEKAANPDLKPQLMALLDAEHAVGELSGRGMMLQETMERMQRKPSAAIATALMQGKLDELRTLKRQLDTRGEQLQQTTADPKLTPLERLQIVEQFAIDTGELQGKTEELVLLNDNLTALYAAKAVADQRRRAAFAAIAAGLQRIGQQEQMHTATCMALGSNMMTCTGH